MEMNTSSSTNTNINTHTPIHSDREEKKKIEESQRAPETYKVKEFLDDYGYSDAKKSAICVIKDPEDDHIYYLVLCSDKGPQRPDQINQQLEWRISGSSDEKGHEGGGNSRNLYGHKSKEVNIVSRIADSEDYISATIYPEAIYKLVSDSTIGGADYDKRRTQSEFVECPKIFKQKDMKKKKGYVLKRLKQVNEKLNDNYGYFQMFEIDRSELPNDYTDPEKWEEFKQYLGMTHYPIEIVVLNEVIGEVTPNKIPHIDMAGLNGPKKTEKRVNLCRNKNNGSYFVKTQDGQSIDIITQKKSHLEKNSDCILNIHMFVADKTYINEQKKKYKIKKPLDDFYGISHHMNGKFTSGYPEHILPHSKNNKVDGHGSAYVRIIDTPYENVSDKLLKKVINTDTIKANTKYHTETFSLNKYINVLFNILRGKYDTPSIPQSTLIVPKIGGGSKPAVTTPNPIVPKQCGGTKPAVTYPKSKKYGYVLIHIKNGKFIFYKTKTKKDMHSRQTQIINTTKHKKSSYVLGHKFTPIDLLERLDKLLEKHEIEKAADQNRSMKKYDTIEFSCTNVNNIFKISNSLFEKRPTL